MSLAQDEFDALVVSHQRWNDRAGGRRLNVSGRSLVGLVLAGLQLDGAVLDGADLAGCDLTGTDLSHASLIEAAFGRPSWCGPI